jgi:hypothetical protein
MNQIEFLLRLSENAQDEGDELAARHNAERAAHTKNVSELYRMLEVAMQNLHSEMHRWGMIQPKAQKLPETAQPQLSAGASGGGNASQARIIASDDKREHSRAASPRQ